MDRQVSLFGERLSPGSAEKEDAGTLPPTRRQRRQQDVPEPAKGSVQALPGEPGSPHILTADDISAHADMHATIAKISETAECRKAPDGRTSLTADDILAHADMHATTATTSEKAAWMKAWRAFPDEEKALTIKALAKVLGCSVADLRRYAGAVEAGANDPPVLVRQHTPHSASVDGEALLNEICRTLSSFIVLPRWAADAIALWILHSHAFALDVFDVAPYLNVSSPEKRCGKTLVLEFLQHLCARPAAWVGPSNAAILRLIAACRPTIILDEADRLFADERANRDLIATINAGHRRGGAALRCVGDNHEPKAFACFAPFVLGGIGELPDTIRDRAIVVRMQRRTLGQPVARRTAETFDAIWRLGEKCARWAEDHAAELRREFERAPRPESLDDRACDVWAPLFAVAAVAGGEWPAKATEAAIGLSSRRDERDPGLGIMLLQDIRRLFDEGPSDRLLTATILQRLNATTERPWGSLDHGRPLGAFRLSRFLGAYGISVTTVRAGTDRGKGYKREDFEDAWARYSAPSPLAVTT